MALEKELKMGEGISPKPRSIVPPVFTVTPGMRFAESQLPEGQTLYGLMSDLTHQGFSIRAIAVIVNVRTETASKWLQAMNLEVQPNAGKRPYSRGGLSKEEIHQMCIERWKDENYRRNHREGVLKGWADKDKKAARVARTQSPEAQAKRVQSTQETWRKKREAKLG